MSIQFLRMGSFLTLIFWYCTGWQRKLSVKRQKKKWSKKLYRVVHSSRQLYHQCNRQWRRQAYLIMTVKWGRRNLSNFTTITKAFRVKNNLWELVDRCKILNVHLLPTSKNKKLVHLLLMPSKLMRLFTDCIKGDRRKKRKKSIWAEGKRHRTRWEGRAWQIKIALKTQVEECLTRLKNCRSMREMRLLWF